MNTLRGTLASPTSVTHSIPGGQAYAVRQLPARAVFGFWTAADPVIVTGGSPAPGQVLIPLGTPVHFELDDASGQAVNVRKI
jgi:hypothetical protein